MVNSTTSIFLVKSSMIFSLVSLLMHFQLFLRNVFYSCLTLLIGSCYTELLATHVYLVKVEPSNSIYHTSISKLSSKHDRMRKSILFGHISKSTGHFLAQCPTGKYNLKTCQFSSSLTIALLPLHASCVPTVNILIPLWIIVREP